MHICTPCKVKVHQNCTGVAGEDSDGLEVLCDCEVGEHIQRGMHAKLNEPAKGYFDVDELKAALDRGENAVPLPGNPPGVITPEADPGVRTESFPELADEYDGIRLKVRPDQTIFRDLMDVEVQNDRGEWVPMIPLPLYLSSFFWIKRYMCHCKTRFTSMRRYQEHYAYAHILGMDD